MREKDVQLGSHQRHVQGYRKYYRFGGDRIDHDVPSYDRNRIGIEDKRRKDVPARIGGNGGMCRMGNPLDSDQEDVTESVAHAPPAMVFFFLSLFAPLFAVFLLTVYVALCKPGCAISAADTSSV